jgi:hypothetical protein
MMPAQNAISRFRRDLTLGSILNALLLGGVFFCVLLGGAFSSASGNLLLLLILGLIWITLSYHSMKNSRLAANSPSLIAAGQFDLAEYQIEKSLKNFSIFRTSKLLSLHHLAVLRHAQRRWSDAAELCGALLRQRLGSLTGLARQSRLILADSLLEMGDLIGSYDAIAALYQHRLTLAEALGLLHVQLDYQWRVNAWEQMLAGLKNKVEMAELMNTPNGARSQALLALAAKRQGREELSAWLRRRVELLVDINELTAARPVLKELWPAAPAPAPAPAAVPAPRSSEDDDDDDADDEAGEQIATTSN